MSFLSPLTSGKSLISVYGFAVVVTIVAALPSIAWSYPSDCDVPPHREGMFIAYGNGYIEYICAATASSPRREFRLRCANSRWVGHVPQSCAQPTRLPVRRPPPPPPPPPTPPPPPPPLPPPPPHPTFAPNTECGAPPERKDMLPMIGYRGQFIDYYCRPPHRRPWQPMAYRVRCLDGHWQGHLPIECPQGIDNYPQF